MSRLVTIIILVCFLIVPSTVSVLTEDDPAYFPAEFICPDSGFNVAAQLYWITEELKKNAPYEIVYALLYSTLVFLPLIPFLCFLIPSKESLVQQFEDEQKRRQMEAESENKDEDEEKFDVPAQERATIVSRSLIRFKSDSSIGVGLLAAVDETEVRAPRVVMETTLSDKRDPGEARKAKPIIVSRSLILSKSDSSIGVGLLAAVDQNETKTAMTDERKEGEKRKEWQVIVSRSLTLSKSDSSLGVGLLAAVELNKPELRAPSVVMETPLTDKREEGAVTVAEQCPDLTTVDTADSCVRIKELAEKMYPESTLGKTCVMVAAGAFISYGIYHLLSK